jgi:4-diphosphocytidyl-2-C-methyl-D-erythritol kinase
MKVLSPAKVNLHLEVLEKRADGYHEIQSLMTRIDLFDEIEIHPGGQGIRLVAEGEMVPGGPENLACRATELFCRETEVPGNFEVRLKKNIPVAAGLGGGSGNAAAVLLSLNELYTKRLEWRSLLDLGSRLGADVPFFLFQKSALARGKGDRLTAAKIPEGLGFLLLVPPFRVSTPWAYDAFDQITGGKTKGGTLLGESYPTLSALLPVLKNDLEIPALSRYPEIGRKKEELLRLGAKGALMSGSGPVVFGLFASKGEAEEAGKRFILAEGWKSIPAQGI